MWIVTSEVNDYDQYGEYFVCAFIEKPTKKQLTKSTGFTDESFLRHLLKGGGRKKGEGEWYHLTEYKEGEASDNWNF